MSKKLPVGIENFEEFVTQDFYYVDKTMFIAQLLHSWGKVNLFTRPRRFGKSLTMSMLKAFFEIGTEKSLFTGLDILKEEELCHEYMGNFPVISISLKGVDGLDYQAALMALKNIIGMEMLRFQFLAKSDRLSDIERALYTKMIAGGDAGFFAMSEDMLLMSLQLLSQLLSKHYDRKVIILIDEYDVPLDKAFQAGYYDEMVSLIRNLFGNALKSNEYLYFAVLTGCLRISKESIFTGMNNLKIHTITDTRYDEYFGFTDADVEHMLAFYGLSDHGDLIRKWYDGYQFGRVSVYCPWDVINYCDALLEDPESQPENYWANTSGNALIRRFIGMADRQTRNEIEHLVAGECITKAVNQELTYNELYDSVENLWSVLFSTGYLTQKGRTEGKWYRLAIPNREILELFTSQITQWFKETTRSDSGMLKQFCQAFLQGNEREIEQMLRTYLWNAISIRDTAIRKDRKESFYHGMLLGLLQYESEWDTVSNAESGEGYCDISIKTPEQIGVVIEIKYAEDGNLEKSCASALAQIQEKNYDAALIREGMETVIKYGISFYKKTCKVVKDKT